MSGGADLPMRVSTARTERSMTADPVSYFDLKNADGG
jgi:hypothetical protein